VVEQNYKVNILDQWRFEYEIWEIVYILDQWRFEYEIWEIVYVKLSLILVCVSIERLFYFYSKLLKEVIISIYDVGWKWILYISYVEWLKYFIYSNLIDFWQLKNYKIGWIYNKFKNYAK